MAFKVSRGSNWERGSLKLFWGQIYFQTLIKNVWSLTSKRRHSFQHCIGSPLKNVLMSILFKKGIIFFNFSDFNQIVFWLSRWIFGRVDKNAFCVAILGLYGMKIFLERTYVSYVLWFGSPIFQSVYEKLQAQLSKLLSTCREDRKIYGTSMRKTSEFRRNCLGMIVKTAI